MKKQSDYFRILLFVFCAAALIFGLAVPVSRAKVLETSLELSPAQNITQRASAHAAADPEKIEPLRNESGESKDGENAPAEETPPAEYTRPAGFSLPIVMYHSTHPKAPGKYNVTPGTLERDLAYIKARGYTPVTVADLLCYRESGQIPGEKQILISFDDGYTNNYTYAFPLFKKYGSKCVMSVVGIITDANYKGPNGTKKPTFAHMDYDQIKELSDSGLVEIQNHTYDMHKNSGSRLGLKKRYGETESQYEEALSKDLCRLSDSLKTRCGIACTAVAYPFGAYSKETVPILQKLGYRASFSCTEGINYLTRETPLFDLLRYNRPTGPSSEAFFGRLFRLSEAKNAEQAA